MIVAKSSAMPSSLTTTLVWQGTQPKDLNQFITGPSPFAQLLAALSISDAGEIIGFGVARAGELHAFLASPNNDAVRRW
jgi:hypothetical protein